MPPVGLEVDRYDDSAFLSRFKQEYGFFFASFDPFTAKGGQSQNLNVISQNAEKQIVTTERTDEEVSVCT